MVTWESSEYSRGCARLHWVGYLFHLWESLDNYVFE